MILWFFKVSLLLLIEVFLKFGSAPAEQTNAVCAGIGQERILYSTLYFPLSGEYYFLWCAVPFLFTALP